MTDYRKEFIRELDAACGRYERMRVFSDACEFMAMALEQSVNVFNRARQAEVEKCYLDMIGKYSKDERAHFPKMLGIVATALEETRDSFLGPVLEEIGAAAVRNGQFLTPWSVAKVMADVSIGDVPVEPGKIVTVDDPACGAGVTLIAQGEAMLQHGYRQSDILLTGGDIDGRACDITYIELTILGYAGIVRHEDALAMKKFSPDRYTLGYFLHGMPMRRGRAAAQ